MRDLAKEWREREEVARRALEEWRVSLVPETDAVRNLAKKCREQTAAAQSALERQQLLSDSIAMTLRSTSKKLQIQDMQAWRSYGPVRRRAMRDYLQKVEATNRAERQNQDVLTTFDNQNGLQDFVSLYQTGDMEFTVRLDGQQFSMNIPKESACNEHQKAKLWIVINTLHSSLCSFISEVMNDKAKGSDWKGRIPREVRDRCERDRDRDNDLSRSPASLLTRMRFKELSNVICSRENWHQIFEPIFENQEKVKGSLTWLNEIRNNAAHGHSVSKDEVVRLHTEFMYISVALKKQSN